MDIEIARAIVNAGEEIGLDVNLREDYSGRGMFGQGTAGVVCNLQDFCASVAYASSELAHDDTEDDMIDAMRTLRSDNMGCNSIFY